MIKFISVVFIFIFGLQFALPAFSAKKQKRDNNKQSIETTFIEKNFSEKKAREWESGREFICVTHELPIFLAINDNMLSDNRDFKGSIFRYKILEEESSWQGKESSFVFTCGEDTYRYKIKKSAADILNGDFKPLLPELVPLDYISLADSLLKGRNLYIKTPRWLDSMLIDISGRKFVPVTITAVEAGDKILPLRVVFRDEFGMTASVLTTMYVNSISAQYTTFDRLFSFTDPKNKYPNIKDDIWQLITSCKVTKGMTKDECRLSVGNPDDVRQIPGYSGLCEQWFYNTGTYLVFQDGLLVSYRL
ncbi:MAG: hypothetical protein RR293_06630 [Bacteroidales bacterium]